MFISSSKEKLIKPKSIQKVTYYLHPTFHPSTIENDKPPFYLKRLGWGVFDVRAKIEFKAMYNKKDISCTHELDFDHYASITPINDDSDDDEQEYVYGK